VATLICHTAAQHWSEPLVINQLFEDLTTWNGLGKPEAVHCTIQSTY